MKKVILSLLLLPGLLAAAPAPQTPPGVSLSKPNILFILADDMGYSDAGCYGSEIKTPNLDALAANGLRFTEFYNTGRCWPSRASIMTGFYPQEVRRDKFSDLPDARGGMGDRPCWAQLLPVMLKPEGYHSYHSGKWHLDGKALENGFEHSLDVSGHKGFFDSSGNSEDGQKLGADNKPGTYYSTIAIAEHAIKCLKEHAAKYPNAPFFEYLAFHSPHFPIQALPEDIAVFKDRYKAGWDAMRQERFDRMKKMGIVNCDLSPLDPVTIPSWNFKEEKLKKQIGENEVCYAVPWKTLTPGQQEFQAEKMAVHAAMVYRMDLEIGRVLAQIKAMGALDNTLVVFASDNGASAEQIIRGNGHKLGSVVGSPESYLGIGPGWASLANTPNRLYKSWNHEGGISTPLIVSWPAGIKAHGELRANPGHLVDLVPTALEIAGAKQAVTVNGLPVPPFAGKSLVPAFAKDGTVPHDFLWFNHIGNRAIRVGDWKLVAESKKPWELYNLKTDRSETKNLAASNPEKVKELEKAWLGHAEEFHALSLQDPSKGGKKAKGGGEEE